MSTIIAERISLNGVMSSLLSAVGYNREKQILAVEFSSGAIFHYAGVPPDLFQAFIESESYGRYYSQHIRGKFQGEKMTGPCPNCGASGWVGERCADCGTAEYVASPRRAEPVPPKAEAPHG